MTSQTGKQINTRNRMSNISRSKGNQRMKSVQLMEYNMRNICLKKTYTKFGGETSSRLFFTF